MKNLAFGLIIALAPSFGVGACTTVCDCEASFDGLTITASAPVTAVALSGKACATGRFNCDYTLTNTCSQIRVEAVAAGPCIVDLTVAPAVAAAAISARSRGPSTSTYG
jgi:hypothetical protein